MMLPAPPEGPTSPDAAPHHADMTNDAATPPPARPSTTPTVDSSSPVSRRRFLAGAGAVTLGLVAGARLAGGPRRAAAVEADELNVEAEALAPAQRVTTTTTTTVAPFDVPAAGRVAFPVIVGPGDRCHVLDNFGDCRGSGCSRLHEGVDIMADRGLPVRAVVSGRLTKRYEDYGSCGGAGNGWTLHDADADVTYKFFHLDRHADGLEQGDEVVAGQIIGYVGETGTSGVCSATSHNYHLHFEYRPGNVARDSFDLLERPEHVTFA